MFSSAEHFTTVRKLVKTDSEAECQRKVRRPNKLFSTEPTAKSGKIYALRMTLMRGNYFGTTLPSVNTETKKK